MPITNYYTIEGEILGEKTSGGNRTDYLTDALGSVTATVNQNSQVVTTYRYRPYGSQLAKTGTGPDPAYSWVGTLGYRQTGNKFSDIYVRARHLSSTTGRWSRSSLLNSMRAEYVYALNNPVTYADPTMLQFLPSSPPEVTPSPSTGVGGPLPAIPTVPTVPTPVHMPEIPPWLRCCSRFLFVFGLLICSEEPAGPTPKENQSCKEKYPSYKDPLTVYYEPSFTKSFSSTGPSCDQAISQAYAALQKAYPRGSLEKGKTDPAKFGPCTENGKHVVVSIRGSQKIGKKIKPSYRKVGSIVCCPTCYNLPEVNVGIPGCKCGVLYPNRNPRNEFIQLW